MDCKLEENQEHFCDKLKTIVEEVNKNELLILMGDFNARISSNFAISNDLVTFDITDINSHIYLIKKTLLE